ncbi:MAG: hypothetical protein JJE51_13755 [Thermoanaerobaculia bacterium]|nr:hypothetical protein [Thermoanaerobaculia bacterium]
MTRSERIVIAALAAIAFLLKAILLFRYRFDSDEPQHLHVTWGWTAGLVQYRDVFDNHAPLFHIATAPLLALLGERADILIWMRLAMLPLFAAVVICTWLVGRSLYSHRAGAWAAVLLMLFPPFFLKSLEYRNDNAWNALWMVALTILVMRPITVVRAALAGLLLGAALAVSMKTGLLLLALAGSALLVRALTGNRSPIGKHLAAALASLVIAPLTVMLWFVQAGAFRELVFGVYAFNSTLSNQRTLAWAGRVAWPFAIALIVWIARRNRDRDPRRLFLALVPAFFTVTLVLIWLLVSPRDLLPMMPIAAVLVAGWAEGFSRRVPLFAAIAALSCLALVYYADRFENRTDEHITMMNQTLRLTRPGEPLMDIKGETIYRRRPFYFAFETLTREQMRRGLINDTIAEDVIAARCYAAQADGPMLPPRGRRFLADNFIDMGRLRAAGQWIGDDGSFTIAIPGAYVVLDETGHATGALDGRAYSRASELTAGPHHFERTIRGQSLAVVWAPAFERGHSPFHLRDLEF